MGFLFSILDGEPRAMQVGSGGHHPSLAGSGVRVLSPSTLQCSGCGLWSKTAVLAPYPPLWVTWGWLLSLSVPQFPITTVL